MKIYSPKTALQYAIRFPKLSEKEFLLGAERIKRGFRPEQTTELLRDFNIGTYILHLSPERGPSRFPQSDESTRLPTREAGFPKRRETPLVDDMALQGFHLKKNVGYIVAVKAQRIANVAVIYASSTTAALKVMPDTCKRCVGRHPEQILIEE
jgi:hypothetical protein